MDNFNSFKLNYEVIMYLLNKKDYDGLFDLMYEYDVHPKSIEINHPNWNDFIQWCDKTYLK